MVVSGRKLHLDDIISMVEEWVNKLSILFKINGIKKKWKMKNGKLYTKLVFN